MRNFCPFLTAKVAPMSLLARIGLMEWHIFNISWFFSASIRYLKTLWYQSCLEMFSDLWSHHDLMISATTGPHAAPQIASCRWHSWVSHWLFVDARKTLQLEEIRFRSPDSHPQPFQPSRRGVCWLFLAQQKSQQNWRIQRFIYK